jgi:hypothetical protein
MSSACSTFYRVSQSFGACHCVQHLEGIVLMSEVNDYSRRRWTDFLAARIQPKHSEKVEHKRSREDAKPSMTPGAEQSKPAQGE